MIELELLNSFSSSAITAEQWNTLTEKNETNTIFQTYEWHKSWWETFGAEEKLLCLIFKEDNAIIGIAPLMLKMESSRIRRLCFISESHSDYLDFIFPYKKDILIARLLEYIYKTNKLWNRLDLKNIPSHSSTIPHLANWHINNNMHYLLDNNFLCPTLYLKNNKMDAMKLINKYSNKRATNYYNKKGKLAFRKADDTEKQLELLPLFFEQHIARWKMKRERSLFLAKSNKEFYKRIVQSFSGKDFIHFTCVEFENEPIAFHFGFIYNNALLWYKPAFDPEFSAHSPGIVLIRHLIEYALNNNLNELDFTVGNEKFKYRFANITRYNINFRSFSGPVSYYYAVLRKMTAVIFKSIFRQKN